jgi:Asp-tRNA(Asn)/Glu-tRNA(Gln) amidotransferase A subunit family amidase
MGSPIWLGHMPGNNARIVDSILDDGGVMVGKTVTAEFAVHALNETLNPRDITRTPGTSSSGSAASVATGMVPFALGSQTAGSISRPASFCGVWGMKPSFGLIPRTGILKTCDTLDTIGFLTSRADNLKHILDTIRVKGPDYPFVYKNVDLTAGSVIKSPIKVGFLRTYTWDACENYVKYAVENFINKLAHNSGYAIKEINLPDDFNYLHEMHEVIYTKSLSYYFKNEMKQGENITEIMKAMIQDGEKISVEKYLQELGRQDLLSRTYHKLLEEFDIIISTATGSSAPLRGDIETPDPSLMFTSMHVPSVTAPFSECPLSLPFGIQFSTKRWGDYRLIQIINRLIEEGFLRDGVY